VGRVTRERIQPAYVYFSADHAGRSRQRLERQSHRASLSLLVENPDLAVEEAKAAIVLFLSTLDERQRRLYAGLESRPPDIGAWHSVRFSLLCRLVDLVS
jgi:hypothetical protein